MFCTGPIRSLIELGGILFNNESQRSYGTAHPEVLDLQSIYNLYHWRTHGGATGVPGKTYPCENYFG